MSISRPVLQTGFANQRENDFFMSRQHLTELRGLQKSALLSDSAMLYTLSVAVKSTLNPNSRQDRKA